MQLLHATEDLQGYFTRSGNPSLLVRSSSIFTDDGCQIVRPRGVLSHIAFSRLQFHLGASIQAVLSFIFGFKEC